MNQHVILTSLLALISSIFSFHSINWANLDSEYSSLDQEDHNIIFLILTRNHWTYKQVRIEIAIIGGMDYGQRCMYIEIDTEGIVTEF